jgi:hypothetical protein
MSTSSNNRGILQEADELAKSRNWTRSFALYVMYCRAMAVRDKVKAESCMNILEQEVMNSLAADDSLFLEDKREK